jgi:hypothetical protein
MQRCVLVTLLLGSLSAIDNVAAQVDQDHFHAIEPSASFNLSLGLQQEFTPTLGALDSVQLLFNASTIDPIPLIPQGATLAVAIRQGGVDGGIIGTSMPLNVPGGFSGALLFRFADPVDLVPGANYVLQPLALAGYSEWAVDGSFDPGYPRGRLWFNGSFWLGDTDLIFREGIGVPEPTPSQLLALGLGMVSLLQFWRMGASRVPAGRG